MKDEEIIKALECCSTNNQKCYECPLHSNCLAGVPSKNISRASLDLIQRQQAEIELLKQRRVNMFEIINAFERGRTKGIQELTDKIVEQLESEIKWMKMLASETCSLEAESHLCGLNKAIEIVKGGAE